MAYVGMYVIKRGGVEEVTSLGAYSAVHSWLSPSNREGKGNEVTRNNQSWKREREREGIEEEKEYATSVRERVSDDDAADL